MSIILDSGPYDIVDFCLICQGDFHVEEHEYYSLWWFYVCMSLYVYLIVYFDFLSVYFQRLLQDVRLKALSLGKRYINYNAKVCVNINKCVKWFIWFFLYESGL